MPDIRERIKELRKMYGYTQESLAKSLGLNAKSSIANYENGSNSPSDEIKFKMCKLFDCTMDYLMGLTNVKEPIDGLVMNNLHEETKQNLYNIYEYMEGHKKIDEQKKQFYMCPVYGQISAGQPNWAEENIEGRIPIDYNLMNIINPEEHFFLKVNGESMNKIIKNGAFALIHKQDIVNDGEIAVVLVNGYNATLKKFTKQGEMIILEPQSYDDTFKTQVYDKTTSIKILGKYVGKMEFN